VAEDQLGGLRSHDAISCTGNQRTPDRSRATGPF
jgi:hypothetical protein